MNELKFVQCQLTENDEYIRDDMFYNIKDKIFDIDERHCKINCEIINNKYYWIYIRFGEAKPYSNDAINTETKELMENSRKSYEAELRKQIFCLYNYSDKTLYTSNFKQNAMLKLFLDQAYQKKFNIKKYFAIIEDFAKEINSIKTIKFSSSDRNLFNDGIFKNIEDIYGLGNINAYNLELKLSKNKKIELGDIIDKLNIFKNKKDEGSIDKIIFVGEDDKGVEKIFNLDTFLKKISIPIEKDENQMYDEYLVKNKLIEIIGR